MSQIEELIQQLCPDGVEFKELGDVCEVQRGKRLTKKELSDDAKFPVFHGGLEPLGFFNESNRIANTVMVINVGASAGTVGYSSVDFWSSDGCFCISQSDIVIAKFLYYTLVIQENTLKSKVRKAGIPTLDSLVVSKIQIPLPPLAIQQEIVSILDKFTQLEAELEAELEARRAQYNFYRNQLLNFEGKEVEWKMLGEVGEITTGQKPYEIFEVGKSEYPYINAGLEPSGSLGFKNTTGQTITIPSRGQGGAGYVGFQIKDFWCGPLCYKIKSNKSYLNTKYLYYYLKIIQDKIIGLRKIGSIPAVNKEDLKTVLVHIPQLAEQERIVGILDKFDTLVNDISVGLPAEIAARRKQYEYYREKLLNFKSLTH